MREEREEVEGGRISRREGREGRKFMLLVVSVTNYLVI